MESLEIIGRVHCPERYRYEAPRQGAFAENSGVITLEAGHQYEVAAADLNGFSRIWVIFLFHLNENWSVKVSPPIAPSKSKIGVFATRSPHRPNRIGMSCVELERVEGRNIYIRNFDMLDLTPVVDIKPYIPAADAFPNARTGWLERAEAERYKVIFEPIFEAKSNFIKESGLDLLNFCEVQLCFSPLDSSRRRLFPLTHNLWEIGCRTWRILFEVDLQNSIVKVLNLRTNYTPQELAPNAVDRYGDLQLHREYIELYNFGYSLE